MKYIKKYWIWITVLLAEIVILSSVISTKAQPCDTDGVRSECPSDDVVVEPGDQTYEDSDLDDGRDPIDTPEEPSEELDNGRDDGADSDFVGESNEDTPGELNNGR